MLTAAPPSADRRGRRFGVVRSLVWPTVRVARLDRVGATVLLGSIPLLVTVVRSGSDLSVPSVILGLVTGASMGWIADDPTVDVLTPCPVNTPRRLACRALLAVFTALAVAGAVLAFAAIASAPAPSWTERVPELLFAAMVALAVGFTVMRRGDPLGGVTGVTAGALLPALVAALAFRWPETIPAFGSGPSHSRWWVLVLIGAFVAARSGGDPASPSMIRRALEVR